MSPPWLPADWPAPRGVRGFTTVRYGLGESHAPFDQFNLGNRYAADGDDPATVERNRQQLCEHARLPSRPHWLRQVHGIEVERFDVPAQLGAVEPQADAMVTSTPDVVLAILTADCLPVLFSARDGSEVAGAHAGWRGLADGMLEATLAAMRTPAAEVLVWLGPAAGPQRYEVGREVRDAFVSRDAGAVAAFVATRADHWHVNLYELARRRLVAAGVPTGQIHGGGLCTISDTQRFFSHRRDGRTGRMATLIWMDTNERDEHSSLDGPATAGRFAV